MSLSDRIVFEDLDRMGAERDLCGSAHQFRMRLLGDLIDISEARYAALWDECMAAFGHAHVANDPAHQNLHFADVAYTGFALRNFHGQYEDLSWVTDRMIVITATVHDLFSWSRVNHHTLAGKYVRESDHAIFNTVTGDERELIALACEQHRASYKLAFSNRFSELMNSADLGTPDPNTWLYRAMQCAKGRYPYERFDAAVDHLADKFSRRSGYCRVPAMYKDMVPNYSEKMADLARYIQSAPFRLFMSGQGFHMTTQVRGHLRKHFTPTVQLQKSTKE